MTIALDRADELKQTLRALNVPEIKPFLNLTDLVRSATFSELVDLGLEYIKKHGDTTVLLSLVRMLNGHPTQVTLVRYLGEKSNVSCVGGKEDYSLVRGEPFIEPPETFSVFRSINEAPIKKTKNSTVGSNKKAKAKRKRHDLMDSFLVLPGSYGSGKRR